MSHSTEEYEAAAKKLPGNRSTAEQALVDEGKELHIGNVRNLDYEAEKYQKAFGH